jgi:hypothetical protein
MLIIDPYEQLKARLLSTETPNAIEAHELISTGNDHWSSFNCFAQARDQTGSR